MAPTHPMGKDGTQESKGTVKSTLPVAVVVNDSRTELHAIAGLLQKAGLEPRPFRGAEAALAGMDPNVPPAIIVSDVHMPGIDGWMFCRLLRSADYAAFNDVPILVVSATFAGAEPARIASDLGAEAFLAFPASEEQFIQQVQSILQGKPSRHHPRILIIEDSQALAGILQNDFSAAGYRADVAFTAAEAVAAFAQVAYDVAVIDYHLPDGTGDVLLDRFRIERPGCVCIMITGDLKPALSLDWMKRGAAAYLCKPFDERYLLELCARARRERALMRVPKLLEQRTRELRQSEERLASVLETQQELICRFTPAATITFVNPAFCRFFGQSPAERIGSSFWALVPDASQPGIREALARLAADKPVRTAVHPVVRPGHALAFVEWTGQALFDESGKIAEYQFVGRDITGRKRVEEALDQRMMALIQPLDSPEGIEMEALFNLEDLQRLQDEFAEATGVASVITRIDGTPLTRPSRFTRLCELIRATPAGRANCFRSDALIGGHCAKGPSLQPCLSGGLWDAGAGITVGGRHIANWLIGQVRDGTQTEAGIRAYAREIGADEEAVAKAFLDVPILSKEQFAKIARMLNTLAGQHSNFAYQNVQQARFINDLRRAEEQMLASTERLATVMDSMEAIVTIADMPNHDLLFLNEYGRQVCGDSDQQTAWKTLQGLEGSGQFCADERLVDASGKPAPPWHWEHQDPVSGNWYEIRVCAIEWTDGRLVRMGIASDITDRKRIEEKKRKLEAKLLQAQKLETIGQLAAGVAHDFNNLFGVILGYTELALDHADPASSLHDELEEIQKAAERSASLTRQLLGFARKQTIVPRVLDLNETVAGMLDMLGRLIGSNIDLVWEPGADLGWVKVDPSQIDQILVNLCINSRDAIADVGKITLSTRAAVLDASACDGHEGAFPGTYVLLVVSDNGCGMDAEMLTHIFEPFFTTKDLSQGAGLGLSTVYGIVRQNNGLVDIVSEPNKGTSILIYLPRNSAKSRPVSADADKMQFALVQETILLVEDEAALLNMTRSMLERRGYRVLPAHSPAEAIELATEHVNTIDMLMTDVIMPDMGGRDLAAKILGIQPGLRCLFMSGHTADVLAQRGVLAEDVHFVQKPFSMKILAAKVREVLDSPPPGGS